MAGLQHHQQDKVGNEMPVHSKDSEWEDRSLVSIVGVLDAMGDILRIVKLIELLSFHTYGAYDLDKEHRKVSYQSVGSAFAALRAVIPYKACYIDFPRLYLPRESLANVLHIRHSGPTKFEAVYLVLLKAR